MELMKYSKPFALAAVLALVVGCGGSTQEGVSEDVVADEVLVSDEDARRAEAEAARREAAARAEQMQAEAGAMPEIFTIYFDFDKSNIRSEFYDVLNAHAAYLMANPNARVVLEGHTDERGTREYNMALGERRGQSVQRYLSLQGVASSQMEVVSYGEERPAVRGTTREAHAQNRRVEFNYR